MSLIEITPTYSKKSNSSYGIRYENQLIELSLMNINGLNSIDDPDLYLEQERYFTSLKMVAVEKNKMNEEQIKNEVLNSLRNGKFYILPGILEKIKIKINKEEYYIKFDGKKIYLFDNEENDISKEKLSFIYDINYYIKCNNYNFDLSIFGTFHSDIIKAIGDFDQYFVFFFKSVMENDGLFITKNKFNLSDFKVNVIYSYNIDDKKQFNEINQNSFLIYETKSNNNFKDLLTQMIHHSDYISKFLFYFNSKFNINNLAYYIGFIKENTNEQININDYIEYITILQNKQLNFAILQIKDSIFGEKIIFNYKSYQKINNIEINILKINKELNVGLKEIESHFNVIGQNFNNIDDNFKKINQHFTETDGKFDIFNSNFTNINDNFTKEFDEFKNVDNKIGDLGEQIQTLNDNTNSEINKLNIKIDNQFKKVDNQFKNIDNQFKKVDNQFESLKNQFTTNNTKIDGLVKLLTEKVNNDKNASQASTNNNRSVGNPTDSFSLLFKALLEPLVQDIIKKNNNNI